MRGILGLFPRICTPLSRFWVCPGSPPWCVCVCPEYLLRELYRKHFNQIPKPPQLAPSPHVRPVVLLLPDTQAPTLSLRMTPCTLRTKQPSLNCVFSLIVILGSDPRHDKVEGFMCPCDPGKCDVGGAGAHCGVS